MKKFSLGTGSKLKIHYQLIFIDLLLLYRENMQKPKAQHKLHAAIESGQNRQSTASS